MQTMNRTFASVAVGVLAAFGLIGPTPVTAQLPSASAITLAKAGNSTATARGLEAISVNPAGLGMPGSGFSISFLPVQARTGLSPITLSDLADVQGELLSPSTKEEWLSRISQEGRQTGLAGADATWLALTFGNFGFQASTAAVADMDLAPDVAELALYGNAGRTGNAAALNFSGSEATGWAVSTAAFGFAIPIGKNEQEMAIGATLKYLVGHGVGVGEDQGGGTSEVPVVINLAFPSISIDDEDPDGVIGTGFGLDLGFQMEREKLSVGVAVRNLFNTFAWDEDELFFRPGIANYSVDDDETDFDKQPYDNAPGALRELVENMTFKPSISIGAAYDVANDFTVSGDVHNRFSDTSIAIDPKFHAGVGLEFRGIGFFHMRAGAAAITGGTEFSGGASLILGPVNISGAAAMRQGDDLETVLAQFTLSFSGR